MRNNLTVSRGRRFAAWITRGIIGMIIAIVLSIVLKGNKFNSGLSALIVVVLDIILLISARTTITGVLFGYKFESRKGDKNNLPWIRMFMVHVLLPLLINLVCIIIIVVTFMTALKTSGLTWNYLINAIDHNQTKDIARHLAHFLPVLWAILGEGLFWILFWISDVTTINFVNSNGVAKNGTWFEKWSGIQKVSNR